MLTQHYYLYGDIDPNDGAFSLRESRDENMDDVKAFAEMHTGEGIIYSFDGPRPSPTNLRPQYIAEIRIWDGFTTLMWFKVYRYPDEEHKYKPTQEDIVKKLGTMALLGRMYS